MPEGDSLIVIWIKLLCLAGTVNDSGLVYLTRDVPYTDEMLAAVFDKPLTTTRLALNTFERFGMIEIGNDNLLLTSWEKYKNTDGLEKIRAQTKERVAKHRKSQKLLTCCNVTSNVTVTPRNATDKDIDIDKNISSSQSDFDVFWKAYPKKVGKEYARRSFAKAKVDIQTLLSAIEKQKQSEQWQRDNGQYIPNPSTWLNQGRWEDELPIINSPDPPQNQPAKPKQYRPVEIDGEIVMEVVADDG